MSTGGPVSERVTRIERQLAAAQQIAHLGSWEWDLATGKVSWSDELYRIYGLEPQSCEVTFEGFLGRLHPDDRERVRDEVQAALVRGGAFAYPERIVRPDGSVRDLDTRGEVVADPQGRVRSLIGSCRDVTEERRRDEVIRLFADIVENVQIALTVWEVGDPEVVATVRLVAANPAADAVARRHMAPLLGQTLLDIVPFAEGGELQSLITNVARDRRVRESSVLSSRDPRAPGRAVAMKAFPLPGGRVGVALEDITARTKLEEQLRALSAHLETVREEERTGIAREIHDELGQALTALKMDVAWLARRLTGDDPLPSADAVRKLGAMSEATDDVIDRVRRISAALRPGVLDDLGLAAAIEWQAHDFEERVGIPCSVRCELPDGALDRDVSTVAFRTFQEALTNVARHADATRVEVRVVRAGGVLRLDVSDDGRGITSVALDDPGSFGLLGMRERARRLGGSASIGRGEAGGTLVSLVVPLGRQP